MDTVTVMYRLLSVFNHSCFMSLSFIDAQLAKRLANVAQVVGEACGILHGRAAGPLEFDGDDFLDDTRIARHDQYSVSEIHRLGDRVSNEYDRLFCGKPGSLELGVQFVSRKGIERPKGLVHQQ